MASAQVVETSVNTNNSPSQDYTTNPDDHSNYNIDSPGFKPFTVIKEIRRLHWRLESKSSIIFDDNVEMLDKTLFRLIFENIVFVRLAYKRTVQ